MPQRIQLKRTKGWRMPPNTVKVARPSRFGNPFKVRDAIELLQINPENAQQFCVDEFRKWLRGDRGMWQGYSSNAAANLIIQNMYTLTGKDLACYCPLDQPCHADVLLSIANPPQPLY